MSRGGLLLLLALAAAGPAAAQGPGTRALSLDEALRLAHPASESLALARAALDRARGEELRAGAQRFPQLTASFGYNRLLRSQFEGFSFGSDSADGGEFDDLPFGRRNAYSVDLALSQTLYAGGRLASQARAADAGRRAAGLGVTTAEAQLTLDVVTAYFDAALAERELEIATMTLRLADSTLRLVEVRQAAGTQPEFDLLRARVARDNQRTAVIQRRTGRDLAQVRLRQVLNLPLDEPLLLTTPLTDSAVAAVPALAALLAEPPDTGTGGRASVRQAAEAVDAGAATLEAARAQRLPSLVITSQYGRVGYPDDLSPFAIRYPTNWNISLGVRVPLITGGRIRGETMIAEAGLRQAELRLQQAREAAAFATRQALAELEAAEAASRSTEGTVGQAARAYGIAEIRFREGLSTQVELADTRLALQTAESLRARAARDLAVARIRVALLPDLPPGAAGGPSTFVPSGSTP